MDEAEAQLIGRYAQDVGLILYAWNGAMSVLFFIFMMRAGGDDSQQRWSKLGSDGAKLDHVRSNAAGLPVSDLRGELLWMIDRLRSLLPLRNAVVHLGLSYSDNEVRADSLARQKQSKIVAHFLQKPGDLSALFGDLRVLGQYAWDLGIRLIYQRDGSDVPHLPQPTLFFDPAEVAAVKQS